MTTKKSNSTLIIIAAVTIAIFCFCCFVIAVVLILLPANKKSNAPSTETFFAEPDPQTQTWLVMFYLDADDPILEEDIYFDLNEAEMIGTTERVKMVAQIDRSDGAFSGDGDWTSARRYFLKQDANLNALNSEMVADLGEIDMGSRDTLVDFTTWAIENYPADKYVLILSDHGTGFPGGWADENPKNANGNWLHLNDLESALSQTISDTNIRGFELIGMDACLMSMLEVYNGLAPYSRYAVASQETEPSLGWAYASFLADLTARPEMNGAELGKLIVGSYVNKDQRILDDEARRRMLSNFGISADASADEVAQELGANITIAAVDLSAMPQVNSALDNFVYALKDASQKRVAKSRSYSQAFANVFDEKYPSPYIDLANFADFAAQNTENAKVDETAQSLQAALSAAIVAEKHGGQRAGAKGISVYFPVSELFWDENIGYQFYAQGSETSSRQTLWDDFLAFHYAGQDFGLGAPTRDKNFPVPGAEQVKIAPLTITPSSIAPNDSINVQTDINGEQIAYIYLVAMLKHEDRYLAYFIDYVKGDTSETKNGVVYPAWTRTNGAIHIDLTWTPAPNGVCNGTTCAFALVNPDQYTADSKDLLYFVEGWYVDSATGKKIEATMYFNNYGDNLIHSMISSSAGGNSVAMPRSFSPKPNDKFIMLDTWWTIGADGQITDSYQEGNPLTFGDKPFYYVTAPVDAGEYRIGIMVEDMDGMLTYQFAPLTVK